MHNLVIGNLYLWHTGDMNIYNLNTGEQSLITFPEKGWSSKDDYKVYGHILDSNGIK